MQIIIVDDEPGILFLHELMIEESELNGEIFTFSDPEKALKFIINASESNNPVLVLLDINMPRMNGWDLLDKLDNLKIRPNVEVIMATSSIHKSDKEKSRGYKRVKMFLEKPIDIEDCSRINKLLHFNES